jgi:hypothetical protein
MAVRLPGSHICLFCVVFTVCNVSFTVCVALCCGLCERGVIFCVLCFVAVPMPPSEIPFEVPLNNNNNNKFSR